MRDERASKKMIAVNRAKLRDAKIAQDPEEIFPGSRFILASRHNRPRYNDVSSRAKVKAWLAAKRKANKVTKSNKGKKKKIPNVKAAVDAIVYAKSDFPYLYQKDEQEILEKVADDQEPFIQEHYKKLLEQFKMDLVDFELLEYATFEQEHQTKLKQMRPYYIGYPTRLETDYRFQYNFRLWEREKKEQDLKWEQEQEQRERLRNLEQEQKRKEQYLKYKKKTIRHWKTYMCPF